MPIDLEIVHEKSLYDWSKVPSRIGRVASETGILTDVILCEPDYLSMVPSNDVTRTSIANGMSIAHDQAVRQHSNFASCLLSNGVRCHYVAPTPHMPDLAFTRDAILIGPQGLIELRPAAPHRRSETSYVSNAIQKLGVPVAHRVRTGSVEGGDVCLLREGLVLIGYSGDRTDQVGAESLGAYFSSEGWNVILTRFDRQYLHLDTLFTLVDEDLGVACREALDPELITKLGEAGISLLPATPEDVARLDVNVLSLGSRRAIVANGGSKLASLLRDRGYQVISPDISQFTRCGGGPHCLTLPLSRAPVQHF